MHINKFVIVAVIFQAISLQCFSVSKFDTLSISDIGFQENSPTLSEKISKARYQLIDYIVVSDTAKAISTFYLLIQGLETDQYTSLYWNEKFLFSFLFNIPRYMLTEVYNLNESVIAKMNEKINPKEDQLYELLYKKVIKNEQKIEQNINSHPQLNEEEKQFLLLILKTYTSRNKPNIQEEINEQADFFLSQYPYSVYANYVRNYVRYRFSMDNYFGTSIGGGLALMQGKMSNYLTEKGSFIIELSYGRTGKFHVSLSIIPVFVEVKESFTSNSDYVFKRDSSAAITCFNFSFFYDGWSSKRFALSPFMGIGWSSLSSSTYDARTVNEGITAFTFPLVGIELTGNLFSKINYNYFGQMIATSMGLTLRYSYQPYFFENRYKFINGSSHTLTLSLYMRFGGVKRVY
ncbi:MAG: hypothetical protein N2662_07815 [Bacteroidales bacterium]|nr:hypothetical protein [Bacteroidales bacterium]